MANIQRMNNSNHSLIPFTSEQELISDNPETFKAVLRELRAIGVDVNEDNAKWIKRSAQMNQIKCKNIERAITTVFDNAKYKPTWADIVEFYKNQPIDAGTY